MEKKGTGLRYKEGKEERRRKVAGGRDRIEQEVRNRKERQRDRKVAAGGGGMWRTWSTFTHHMMDAIVAPLIRQSKSTTQRTAGNTFHPNLNQRE